MPGSNPAPRDARSGLPAAKRGRVWQALVVLVVGLILGIGVRQLVFVIDFSPASELPIRPVTVRVQSASQVAETREALVEYLFDEPQLPSSLPIDNGDGTYTVRMQLGLESLVRFFHPTNPNGRLVLYHSGHAGYVEPDQTAVDELVSRGNTVLVFDMPLTGINARPLTVELPNGPVTISRHDHMAYLDPLTPGSPIRFFVEPVVVMVNEFGGQYADITMIGLSGGGWTTTLAAAIDTRIDRSYPVAGTLPMAVQFAREDAWGDWEQNEPTLYAIADYPDLYVLGAHQRRQLQVLNEFDPCCFGGDHRSIYESQVQEALSAAGGGSFDVFVDTDNRQHSIGRMSLEAIYSDMETTSAN